MLTIVNFQTDGLEKIMLSFVMVGFWITCHFDKDSLL